MLSIERTTLFWQKKSLSQQSFFPALAQVSSPVSPAVLSIVTMTSTGRDRVEHRFLCPSVNTSNISRVGANSHTENYYSIEMCRKQHDNVSVLDILNCNSLKRHMIKKD